MARLDYALVAENQMSPYIKRDRRDEIDDGSPPATAGELTYLLYAEIMGYLEMHGHSFQTYSEVWGALNSARHEFERRHVAQYEDSKLLSHGDVR